MKFKQPLAPIIVLDPDPQEGREIAGWLRSAGLGMISTVRTCDEAIFMLGRRRADLLIIDDRIPRRSTTRLLDHIASCGHEVGPAIVWLIAGREAGAGGPCIHRPLAPHEVVVRVGNAMQRPDLLGTMDRDRDQAAEHLAAARRMQRGLLPTVEQLAQLQTECGIGISDVCRTGDAVGGDFWGAWSTGGGRLAIALADFAGHGLSAALNTFRLHAIMSEQTLPRGLPARMTATLNQRLHSLLPRGHYATMIYLLLDPARHRVAWCSSAGPPPLFVSTGGYQTLDGCGLPLGVKAGVHYRSHRAELDGPGILCLFSDGLFESGAGSEDIPIEAIAAALVRPANLAADGQLDEAARDATLRLGLLRDRYSRVGHSDDVMVVAIALGPMAA